MRKTRKKEKKREVSSILLDNICLNTCAHRMFYNQITVENFLQT